MSKYRSRISLLLRCLFLSVCVTACGGGGGDGGGVGSGGTGSPIGAGATAVSVGPITGFGSIVVDDVHYNIDGIVPSIEDAAELKLGMVVRVSGVATAATGTIVTATSVSTAAELRGAAGGIDVAAGSFDVLGVTVSTDSATVYDGFTSLSTLGTGQFVQINGLPLSSGGLRATRIEKIAAPVEFIATGPIANLNASSTTFNIGSSTVNFGSAALAGMTTSELANGLVVRVRGQLSGSVVVATKIQRWQAPVAEGTPLSFAGVISGYTSLSSTFTVSDIAVNASAAAITGGNPNRLGNGVKVDVEGTFVNGVLQATKLKIRHIPGAGNLPSFSATGPITQFVSPSNFKVKGQAIDATQAGVIFINGTAANLAHSVSVSVIGNQVVNGVLIATQVTF
ncbi:MAG: DUF5666 domain-containing protein [Polaromonas sp.]